MMKLNELKKEIEKTFEDRFDALLDHCGELTLELSPNHLLDVAKTLRDSFHFEQLIDVCGVDYLHYGKSEWETTDATAKGFDRAVTPLIHQKLKSPFKSRFAVVYHLLSLKNNQRIRLRTFVDDETLEVDSLLSIWGSADWFEREVFDLYGIIFKGHPDLRRILTDYGFIGHPFRKDFPLSGKVEVRYDAKQERVVYEPVQIDKRVLEPKVIPRDSRYIEPKKEAQNNG